MVVSTNTWVNLYNEQVKDINTFKKQKKSLHNSQTFAFQTLVTIPHIRHYLNLKRYAVQWASTLNIALISKVWVGSTCEISQNKCLRCFHVIIMFFPLAVQKKRINRDFSKNFENRFFNKSSMAKNDYLEWFLLWFLDDVI